MSREDAAMVMYPCVGLLTAAQAIFRYLAIITINGDRTGLQI
jgi:hypothetical protein